MRGRGGGKKRGTFQPKRAGLGLPGKRRVVLGYNQNEPPQKSNLTARSGSSAQAEIQALQLQKRGGGRGRGGPGSHKNLYTVEKNLVGAGRSSQNEPHDDNDDDDDVVLVDEEGNDQTQQQNDDLRSVLNERR